MDKYALIFRMDILTEALQPTERQMKDYMEEWNAWIGEIAESGRLAEGGNHLIRAGRVLRSKGQCTEGPYVSNGESVAGYIIVLAKDMNEAARLAAKCPILRGDGTSVEVRQAGNPGNQN